MCNGNFAFQVGSSVLLFHVHGLGTPFELGQSIEDGLQATSGSVVLWIASEVLGNIVAGGELLTQKLPVTTLFRPDKGSNIILLLLGSSLEHSPFVNNALPRSLHEGHFVSRVFLRTCDMVWIEPG